MGVRGHSLATGLWPLASTLVVQKVQRSTGSLGMSLKAIHYFIQSENSNRLKCALTLHLSGVEAPAPEWPETRPTSQECQWQSARGSGSCKNSFSSSWLCCAEQHKCVRVEHEWRHMLKGALWSQLTFYFYSDHVFYPEFHVKLLALKLFF